MATTAPFPNIADTERVSVDFSAAERLNAYSRRLWPDGPPLPFPLRPGMLSGGQTRLINRAVCARVRELRAA